eukprot:TRINITY_DN28330_c0_g1_i1.p1 TRINITY_DN28330_c0_g1~~TRINITY_DN28330_c0_g1_i1.p1  ORF type:complete len:136 (+),score=44.38 TRINITY_DN28330_c0_g1_i1:91-498(+)
MCIRDRSGTKGQGDHWRCHNNPPKNPDRFDKWAPGEMSVYPLLPCAPEKFRNGSKTPYHMDENSVSPLCTRRGVKFPLIGEWYVDTNRSATYSIQLKKLEPTYVMAWREKEYLHCLLYTSPSPRDRTRSRMPSSA